MSVIEERRDGTTGTELAIEAVPLPDMAPLAAIEERSPLKLTVPLLLAAGWGALLTFSITFLMEDGRGAAAEPDRTAVAEKAAYERTVEARARAREQVSVVSTAVLAAEIPPTAQVIQVAAASADSLPAPAAPAKTAVEALGYVGTWGPNARACGTTSHRRGFLPAQITEDSAKAGRTLCRFRNSRRDGIAWTMSADCSDRGRNWTSQVRLLVDGDRLIWSSGKGSASYVRCGRRDG